jgi:hypothetical protein
MRTFPRSLIVLVLLLFVQNYLSAQDKLDLKFGKISPADFDLSSRSFDTAAGAVYIADIGKSEYEGGSKGSFTVVYTRHVRIKILNKNGFDAAEFELTQYKDGQREQKVEKLKGATYNLENGKVVTTKLEDNSVFSEKAGDGYTTKKFTLPSVKEGSIIEVSYNIKSDFDIYVPSWHFQGKYPRLWSEYTVRIPSCFNFVFLSQGYHEFYIKSNQESFKTYSIVDNNTARNSDVYTVSATVVENRWVMKDVPPLKEERFITSIDNYISKIEFQLSELREPMTPRQFMNNWNKASEELLKSQYFGEPLTKDNGWLDSEMKNILGASVTQLDRAKKIFAFVRDNFTCTEYDARLMDNPLRTTFKNRKGNVAEINLLLIAMLKHVGINAEPVLLSTRANGYTHEVYPLMNRFNYVIAGLNIDGTEYYLDATERKVGFTHLPLRCYNGHARFINAQNPDPVFFIADSLKENKLTAVFVANDEKGKLSSSYKSTLGYYESLSIRDKVTEKGKDELLKSIKSQYPAETEITDLEVDSLSSLDEPVHIRYNINLNNFTEDIVYFNPMMAEGTKDNFFKSAQRYYPVEMPYTFDEVYILNMEIPKGYVIDEMPKSARVNLNGSDGMFEYLLSESNGRIMLRSRIKVNRAYFHPSDYEALRGFFDHVVKKHAEVIVFKKKK